ncbi:MAG: NAD(P)H-dependent oxidoreductase [Clostridia bacterium]|nr:NAD(P)H-dependent oxidoreductase [Clostridia bacterium]
MLLFVNACIRSESRTRELADCLFAVMNQPFTELRLRDCTFPTVDEGFLKKRDSLIRNGDFDDPMFEFARQFSQADEIVIAAPYWDLSFPAVLKQYFEQINVVGITFRYTKEGMPEGLCRARKLYYITTAGGNYVPEDYGFGYVKALVEGFYGIHDVEMIKAVGLDIEGANDEMIMTACKNDIACRFRKQ